MSDGGLRKLFDRIRHRQLLVGGTAGACWALVGLASVLLAGMWLDLLWELSPGTRIVMLLTACAVGLGLLAWRIRRSLWLTRPAWTARLLDRTGDCGGTVVSGWELSAVSSPNVAPSPSILTTGLTSMAVAHAAVLAHSVPVAQTVSWRPARAAAGVCSSLVAGIVLLLLFIPSLVSTQWKRFIDPYGNVPPFSNLEFVVEPGDTTVIYGQGLDIRVVARGAPVERMELVIDTQGKSESLPLFHVGTDQWRATVTRIVDPASYFVRAERARSRRYQIGIITTPRIEAVKFQITPPAYTRETTYEGPLPKDGIAGLAGTRVVVWAHSNRPLSGGAIDITGTDYSDQVALQPTTAGGSEVTGEFTIRNHGKFALQVVDTANQASVTPFSSVIVRLDDQRPFVRLIEPPAMSLATPTASVPVTVAAEDDYGIARVQLYRSLNNSRPLPMDLQIEEPPPRRLQERTYLPFAEYGLLPGDEIKLFARVEDNAPPDRQGAESGVVTIRIVSQADFERMLRVRQGLEVLTSKYQQAQRRMESLAAEIKALQEQLADLPPDSPVAQELRDKLDKLAENLRQQARAIEESAEHLLPYDLDKNLTDQLQQLANTLNEAAQSVEAAAGEAGLSHGKLAQELGDVAQRLTGGDKQFRQKATEPLEHLALLFPLLQDESRFAVLALRQRDLAERMAALRGHDGEDRPELKARMRDLEEEQRTLRQELGELLTDIEDHVQRLPDDPKLEQLRQTATEFVTALRDSGAAEAMSDAEAALIEFSGTRAHERAVEAADILDSFLSKCQGMGKACKSCLAFNPGLSDGLGNTVEQLLAEMGLGSGSGSGSGFAAGGSSGYSAQRGGQNNVGMYGGLPTLGPAGMGQGNSQQAAGPGSGGSLAGGHNAQDPALISTDATREASGVGQGEIPLRYRQRVGQYFQRLAEELGQSP